MSIEKIENIIKEELGDFYSTSRTGDTSNVLDEILNELWDLNRGISYMPQGYEHKILDENK